MLNLQRSKPPEPQTSRFRQIVAYKPSVLYATPLGSRCSNCNERANAAWMQQSSKKHDSGTKKVWKYARSTTVWVADTPIGRLMAEREAQNSRRAQLLQDRVRSAFCVIRGCGVTAAIIVIKNEMLPLVANVVGQCREILCVVRNQKRARLR